MIVAIGVDAVAIPRIEALWRGSGERFLARVFTAKERAYCLERARPAESLAARFAAKEAVMKCLGTGWTGGVAFQEIEVARDDAGAVQVAVTGRAAQTAQRLGIRRFHLSLTHTHAVATAFAIAEN